MILEEIVARKKEEVAREKEGLSLSQLAQKCRELPLPRNFRAALEGSGEICLIAEIKKASPSKGIIRQDFDPCEIAGIYTQNGAGAISVLTEINFFRGRPEFLSRVRRVTPLPLLCKDFIIDPYQIYQARVMGADAILLIAAILSRKELAAFQDLAASLGLQCLVEVHGEEELDAALETGARIIGINNRNLHTFRTDLETTFRLKEKIPPGITTVSESGINTRQDVCRLEGAGIQAMLVGEALMRAPDIGQQVRILLGKERPGDLAD